LSNLDYGLSTVGTLKVQGRVIVTLMLRGMRSRFLGHGLGFVVASIGWPLVHMIALLAIYSLAKRAAPFGDSMILFGATGVVPFMTFSYISRWTMWGVIIDRPLLSFPVVKPVDLLLARVLLEVMGSFTSVLTLIVLLWSVGVDFVPRDPVQAAYAYGAAILLGAGMGLMNTVIASAFRGWTVGYSLFVIAAYAGSGILFVPDALPRFASYYLSFNPILQAVGWMRSAYYPGYGSVTLDKGYLVAFGLCLVFFGFLLERMLRGRMTEG
jgi:capsular polysaccharide transport system permease protein